MELASEIINFPSLIKLIYFSKYINKLYFNKNNICINRNKNLNLNLYSILMYNKIINIDDKEVVLLNKIYSSEDGYNTKTIWKFNCEITNGSLADFNRGETIEIKSINDSEYDAASEALLKGIVVKDFERADPYQTSVKINTSNHFFLVNKKNIYERSISSLSALIKVLKEVNE